MSLGSLRNLSFLSTRHKAEEAVAGLPDFIAAAEKAAASILSGEHTQRKPGMGEKFWQYREYDPSDRPQDIDWRQSAKGDRVYVREKEWQTTQTAMIWCQHNANMDFASRKTLPSKQDTAMILALAFGLLLSRAGEQIAPLEGAAPPGRSALAVQKLGEQLLENHTGDLPGNKLRSIPKRSSMILIGDFLSPMEQIEEIFDLLAAPAENALVVQVLDPAELSLPYDGRVVFSRADQAERHTVDNVESIRSAYQQRMRDHMEALKHYCKKHRWHWLLHSTDEDIRKTLFDAWLMMTPENYHIGGAG
ncbi:MAG: DUF58 domain-containing protein [Rhodospirillales bacterium]|nr:DUF58 domain-containing protein [Rhodospirillales bacterium]